MSNANIFDAYFARVDDSSRQIQETRDKLLECVIKHNEVQRIYYTRQKDLADSEIEINKLREVNRKLKEDLVVALIERDEASIKKKVLLTEIERLGNNLENMEKESEDMLNNEVVDNICEQYSIQSQVSLVGKVQEARRKLMRNGFPLSFWA